MVSLTEVPLPRSMTLAKAVAVSAFQPIADAVLARISSMVFFQAIDHTPVHSAVVVALEAAGEAAFADFGVTELVGLLGGDFARRVKPFELYRWGSDPFARGSYSYALPGQAECRGALAAAAGKQDRRLQSRAGTGRARRAVPPGS